MTEFIPNNLKCTQGVKTSIMKLFCENSGVRAQKVSYDTWCKTFNAKIYPNPTPDIKFFVTCYTKNKTITVAK